MSRLEIASPNRARIVMEGLYKDLERRIESSPPGLCPVDMSRAFLDLCHAQTCGKCVPCRIGLGQLSHFIEDVLNGKATMETLDIMEQTALSVMESADCAIGYEAANMVYKGLIGYRDDYIGHIQNNRCTCTYNQPVSCVSLCPAHVDIPAIEEKVTVETNALAKECLEEIRQLAHVDGAAYDGHAKIPPLPVVRL